jgi:hypothetical protein
MTGEIRFSKETRLWGAKETIFKEKIPEETSMKEKE